MTKQYILDEIKRTATENGGTPLGQEKFAKETGIRKGEWYGKYWARWSDALVEAGQSPNLFTSGYQEDSLVDRLIALTRELKRWPVSGDIKMKGRTDEMFPSHSTFSNRASRNDWIRRVEDFCRDRAEYADVLAILPTIPNSVEHTLVVTSIPTEDGFVYLFKAGRFYKIGRSNSAGRREYELSIQLPEKLTSVHQIRTDDPVGIEAYWHKRFEAKRKNGEWFELDALDIKVFKKRNFM